MNFGQALEAMKEGERVRRPNWKGVPYVSLSRNTTEYFDTHGAYCVDCGAFFGDEDIMAEDWEVVE